LKSSFKPSIDSLVVGEREILRQIREGFARCNKWNLVGDGIRLLMKHVVEASKEVYAQTRIGEKQISVVSLAIKKLLESDISKDAKILLIGAGQTNLLVSKFLVKYEFKNVTVCNRSIEKAEKLASKFESEAFLLSELANYKEGFDCMIVCTGATEAIIKKPLYEKIIGKDKSEKLMSLINLISTI